MIERISGNIKPLKLAYLLGGLEKFSFNGIRAMLVVFLINSVKISDHNAYRIYSSILMFSFLTPSLDGWLSSNFLGDGLGIILGASVSVIGCISICIRPNLLIYGLCIMIVGTGFFRAGIPSIIGSLTSRRKAEEDHSSSFTKLYIVYNWGTLAGTILCAVGGERYGWKVSFITATLGLVCAVPIAVALWRHSELKRPSSLSIFALVPLLILLGCLLGLLISNSSKFIDFLAPSIGIIGFVLLLNQCRRDKISIDNSFSLFIFMFVQMIFFALFEQIALSFVVFAKNHVDRTTQWGIIPITVFQSIDPLLTILIGAPVALFWKKITISSVTSKTYVKLISGFLVTALTFQLLNSSLTSSKNYVVSPMTFFLSLVLLVISDFCIVPAGLSFVSYVTSQKNTSFVFGIWLTSVASAMWLAGLVSIHYSISNSITSSSAGQFMELFALFSKLSLGIAVGLMIFQVLRSATTLLRGISSND